MIDDKTFEKLQNASIEDRISVIEAILGSLKNDIKQNSTPGYSFILDALSALNTV
ncbi:hypothetical protein [Synechocystis sp. PCC 7509]|uniref:hypothetical protein n=1 Tax=Synechocystis sp. PCC 7509 TaxID=927677 RepID=UPI0002ABA017|nr:hypothetical protein [Synechocystis sp. PCC 7509]